MESLDNASICCGWCRAPLRSASPRCTQCQATHYCDRRCQKKHWPLHKTRCGVDARKTGHFATLAEMDELAANLLKHAPTHTESLVKVLGLHTPIDTLWCNYLAVRQSPIHGAGIFATRPLPTGALLTTYPAHILVHGLEVELCVGDEEAPDASPQNLQYLCDTYGMPLSPQLRLVGLPGKRDQPQLLGHLINDACSEDVFHGVAVERLRDPQTLRPLLLRYYTNLLGHRNCTFRRVHGGVAMMVVALREIARDEELLASYGMDYWLQKNYGADVDTRHPFILANTLHLYKSDKELRPLMSRAIALDRETITRNGL